MNGAEAMLHTLTGSGVGICFANPGTSEMHTVAALDEVPGMRGVLCLFEGTATGAADGYGRMADRPAAVLVHLEPGLANGLANLHNARRARTPLLAIVGDHATYHKLEITTVIFSNRSYAILTMELERTGAPAAGQAARSLLDLSRPGLDFTAMAEGMGVPASRAETAAEFAAKLRRALAEPGPHLIEAAVLPFS